MFDIMSKEQIKEVVKLTAIEYVYKHGDNVIKNKNTDDRVAVKKINNKILRNAIYYTKEAKFKVFYGNIGRNSYNVFIQKDLLEKICEELELDYDTLIEE